MYGVNEYGHIRLSRPAGRVYADFAKRGFDLVLAPMLLLFSLPVLALAVGGLLATGQKPFYAHRRVGRHGYGFACLKLQTMRPDAARRLESLLRRSPAAAAEWALARKLTDDPRITPLGRFLRRTSIDELPQLWNVIRGDMSLIGPRPITAEELSDYGDRAAAYLRLRPGITGLWQVNGRNRLSFGQRAAFDAEYAARLCLSLDLSIFVRTVRVVLSGSGT